jgi:hypothetical protein
MCIDVMVRNLNERLVEVPKLRSSCLPHIYILLIKVLRSTSVAYDMSVISACAK